jgi:ABC-type proline/glycine betaine transport system ATPase subunit
MKSAVHVGDRIAGLHEGRVYFQGTPAELNNAMI